MRRRGLASDTPRNPESYSSSASTSIIFLTIRYRSDIISISTSRTFAQWRTFRNRNYGGSTDSPRSSQGSCWAPDLEAQRHPVRMGARWHRVLDILALPVLRSFFVVHPNEAQVLVFFGKHAGRERRAGFHGSNPVTTRKTVSVRVRDFNSERDVHMESGKPSDAAEQVRSACEPAGISSPCSRGS